MELPHRKETGFNGSLRYRLMGDRPANEDNNLVAKGYFVWDGTGELYHQIEIGSFCSRTFLMWNGKKPNLIQKSDCIMKSQFGFKVNFIGTRFW